LGVVGVVALTVVLRMYRLSAQSVWWDDYNGLVGLDAPDLLTRLLLARRYNPESAPVYFLTQWFYTRLFGTGPETVRMYSVMLSAITVPVVYLLGRDLFGRRAGLVAGLLFALSPIHVFHDQSIRLYPLFVLLAAISLYALNRGVRTEGRWWAWWGLNIAASGLLAWTHLLGMVLVFTEGLFLLLFLRKLRWRVVAWGLVHVIVLLPTFQWVRTMPYVEREGYAHFKPPTAGQIFADLMGDDATGTAYEIIPSGQTWPFLSPQMTARMAQSRHAMDGALVLAACAALAWMLWQVARQLRRREPIPPGWVLAVMVFVLPVLILSVLSYVWRPCIYPRYTIYSSLGLYVMIGGAVCALPWRWLRGAAVAVLVALYAYQLSYVLPGSTRTDWRGAAALIRAQAAPDDLILAGGPGPAYPHMNIFMFNMGFTPLPIAPVHTDQAVCEKAVAYFKKHGARGADGKPNTVWAVIQRQYDYLPMAQLEEGLRAHGLQFQSQLFMAMEKLSLYRITPGPLFGALADATFNIDTGVDYPKILDELEMDYDTPAKKEEAIRILRRVTDIQRPIDYGDLALSSSWITDEGATEIEMRGGYRLLEADPGSALGFVKLAWAHAARHEYPQAAEFAGKAVEKNGGDSGARLALSFALFKQNDVEGAREELEKAVTMDKLYIRRYGPMMRALYAGDREAAIRAAFTYRAMHGYIPRAILDELGLLSWLSFCAPGV